MKGTSFSVLIFVENVSLSIYIFLLNDINKFSDVMFVENVSLCVHIFLLHITIIFIIGEQVF